MIQIENQVFDKDTEVAYWPDGFWSDDLKTADIVDEYGGFGKGLENHKRIVIPAGQNVKTLIERAIGQSSAGIKP